MATHPAFFVTRADGTTRVVALAMSERVQQAIVEADRGNETRDAKTLVEGVTLRWAIRRLEEALRSGSISFDVGDTELQRIDATDADEAAMLEMVRLKRCDYRVEQGRESYCSAASRTDETAVAEQPPRVLAPTSRAVCHGCQMPAAEYLCSHFRHPSVTGAITFGSWTRSLGLALCETGHDDRARDGGGCRPDGHACWERTVEDAATEFIEGPHPLALPEALDFLDTVWRLCFGRRALLGLNTAKDVASIGQDAHTRSEFEERVIDLGDLISNLKIDDQDLPAETPDAMRKGSLNRLEAALTQRLGAEEYQRCEASIGLLRRLVGMRNGFAHSGAAKDLPRQFGAFGLAYPPTDWGKAWDVIRFKAIAAVGSVRDALQRNI